MEQKVVTVREIAEMVNGEVVGDGDMCINGFGPLEAAGEGEVSFLAKKKEELLEKCKAGVVIVPQGMMSVEGRTVIVAKNPYLASAIIHNYFLEKPFEAQGVHPRAFVGEDCTISEQVSVAPLAVIGKRVTLGERVAIGAGTVIEDDVEIGDDCEIKANVTIYHGTIIGNRVTIHSGSVIGCDGYGYAANEQGEHIKRPQVGIVKIDDDVEIGANCCIDRAAYGHTWIKSGVKIDNLVQLAHNVIVGENSLLVAQAGVAGSTTIGRNVALGGQTATAGHLTIGDRVMVAARGGVHNNQPDGAVIGGAPAIPARQWAKCSAIYNKLPELQAKVRKNSKNIEELQKEIVKEE